MLIETWSLDTGQPWLDCLLLLEIQMWQRENSVVISCQRFWIHYRPGLSWDWTIISTWTGRLSVSVSQRIFKKNLFLHHMDRQTRKLCCGCPSAKPSLPRLHRWTSPHSTNWSPGDGLIKIITNKYNCINNMWRTPTHRFTFSFTEHKLETGKKMNQIFCNLHNLHELWTDVIVSQHKKHQLRLQPS